MQTPTEPTPPTIRKEPGVSSCTPADIQIDPEFEGLVRPLSADEYAGLKASIQQDGCADPLIIWQGEGILLDGHHRKRACEELGVPYSIKEIAFPARFFAKKFALDKNTHRRNLTPAEKSFLMGKHGAAMFRGTPAERRAAAKLVTMPATDSLWAQAVEEAQAELDKEYREKERQERIENGDWDGEEDGENEENTNAQPKQNQLAHHGPTKQSLRQIEKKLAANYGVGRTTVQRAIQAQLPPRPAMPVRSAPVARHESKVDWALERLLRAWDGAPPEARESFIRIRNPWKRKE